MFYLDGNVQFVYSHLATAFPCGSTRVPRSDERLDPEQDDWNAETTRTHLYGLRKGYHARKRCIFPRRKTDGPVDPSIGSGTGHRRSRLWSDEFGLSDVGEPTLHQHSYRQHRIERHIWPHDQMCVKTVFRQKSPLKHSQISQAF